MASPPPHTDSSIVFARSCQCASLSNTWFLGPTRVHVSNCISIGSAVLYKAHDCDRQTDRQTALVGCDAVCQCLKLRLGTRYGGGSLSYDFFGAVKDANDRSADARTDGGWNFAESAGRGRALRAPRRDERRTMSAQQTNFTCGASSPPLF